MQIGLQLYNFREALAADFKGTLREIAKLGFAGVEFANGYGGIEPKELATLLKELKLECAGTMFPVNSMLDPASPVFDYARALHTPAVTYSVMTDFVKEYDSVLKNLIAAGDAAAANGFVFSYHNHWAELLCQNGETMLDRLLADTDPGKVFVEPDVCWLTRGGVRPEKFIVRYARRIRQIHLKDIVTLDDSKTTTELGKGVIDLTHAIEAAGSIGCPWVIYEQDICEDPFRSAAESLSYLEKRIG